MRGKEETMGKLFIYVSPEHFVAPNHPLRPLKAMVDKALEKLDKDFARIYSHTGRPSVPPEYLLKGLVLQFLYSIRSHEVLMDRIHTDMAFRWFIGLAMDDNVWVPTVYTKNQDRLIRADIGRRFLEEVKLQADREGLLTHEHFSVDGTLLQSLASIKSFEPTDGPGDEPRNRDDFRGQKISKQTHCSTTDPDAKLYKKSKGEGAKPCVMGHVNMENRNGFITDTEVTQASGTAEREAAKTMAERQQQGKACRITIGADKGYDCQAYVEDMRELNVTPHVAQKKNSSAIDGRTTRHPGYRASLKVRKRIEEFFGWVKDIAGFRKLRHTGLDKIGFYFTMAAGVFNLVKLKNLTAQT